jgi:hypothetical protein
MGKNIKCHDCSRIIRGCKKVVAIEDHYPDFETYPHGMREVNVKDRIGHYLCRLCRNWLSMWMQGYPSCILILEDGTRESFRDKLDQTLWPGEAGKTKYVLFSQ